MPILNTVCKPITNEQALQAIYDVRNSDYHYDESLGYQLTSDDFDWLDKAKEAIEKQVPVKPTIKQFDEITEEFHTYVFKYFLCGKCGEHIGARTNKYCSGCGQKIDWSIAEDNNR